MITDYDKSMIMPKMITQPRTIDVFTASAGEQNSILAVAMLLELAQWLAKDIRVFNVFNYITLRTVLAALTSLAISFIVGPTMIRKLTAYKIGQSVRGRRTADSSGQSGDAHDGWRAHTGIDRHHHATVGGFEQSLRMGGARDHAGLRHHRLGG